MMDPQQAQADNEALASALSAISHPASHSPTSSHHFHHPLTAPDFSQHKIDDGDVEVDVENLEIPVDDDTDLGFGTLGDGLGDLGSDVDTPRNGFGRPPSIRKACDLCHAAKQKCSGDRPSCTRCVAGGWPCVYAPRQRRRTVPKDKHHHHLHHHHHTQSHHQPQPSQMLSQDIHSQQAVNLASLTPPPAVVIPVADGRKKRKISNRESNGRDQGNGYGGDMTDHKGGFDVTDLGLGDGDEGDEMLTMTDEQMTESIAIDGYLADLPLATFHHNLPPLPPPEPITYTADDFPAPGDVVYPTADMDQHTTSALRDAIFSLNEANADRVDVDGQDGDDGQGHDPHLALLDLTHAMPSDDTAADHESAEASLQQLSHFTTSPQGCPHIQLVPHILASLTSHPLEPKPGTNTPLTLGVFAPLARSLRLFHALTSCTSCTNSPHQTLPQLALLSRTTTILTFPYPPLAGGHCANITVQGAKLTGTGLSEAIEQHIVGVVWDSWRAAVREIFARFERKAQDVITQTQFYHGGKRENGDDERDGDSDEEGRLPRVPPTSAETQRAGLMFQAMGRLVNAMDEVEGN